ncbi:MAG TPA: DUF2508 family protein [Syntrophothermus lipocalidus]|nr:DUF2508 family protein [Syntrophothermus lipocalidus]
MARRRRRLINLKYIVERIKVFLFPEEELAMNKPVPLEDLLAQAYQDWVVARLLFDENQDPDMIDFTIYNLKAAEHRYCYLLKKARQEYNIDCAYHRQPTNSFEAGLFL